MSLRSESGFPMLTGVPGGRAPTIYSPSEVSKDAVHRRRHIRLGGAKKPIRALQKVDTAFNKKSRSP